MRPSNSAVAGPKPGKARGEEDERLQSAGYEGVTYNIIESENGNYMYDERWAADHPDKVRGMYTHRAVKDYNGDECWKPIVE